MNRTYLDHNATTTLRPEARKAMVAALGATGNASSVHREGRAARRVVEEARETIAGLMHARPADVVFTAGATEAANWLLTPDAPRQQNAAPLARLLINPTEHAAVLEGHCFPADAVEMLKVDGEGLLDPGAVAELVAELTEEHGPASVVVAVQAANSETGVVQPLAEIDARLADSGATIVCDGAQYAGKLPFGGGSFHADAMILSAHKLGGPQGVGAVVFGGDYFRPEPLLRGGGQEKRRRAGTENVAAIAGFAAAATAAFGDIDAFAARTAALRDRLEAFLREQHPNLVVFGAGAPRLPNTSNFAVPGVPAETLLIGLDLAGVAVSSGSACSSGKVAASHVLSAMGVAPALAKCAIRITFGWDSEPASLDSFATAWRHVINDIAPGKIQAA